MKPFFANFSLLLKRAIDITAAALGILLLSPFYFYVIFLIKREGSGPVLYRGQRVGMNGRIFEILKFRTMRDEPAAHNGPKVTAGDDPRVTPLGRWLRHTKLNELPQLWNILVGDMSLVGPRPEDPELAAAWPESVRREILSVRPGLTSPASVQFRNEEEMLAHAQVMDAYLTEIVPSKLRLDQLYVRHRSIWLDLDTIFWTAILLLPRLRRYDPDEALLFWGPANRIARRHLSWFVMDLMVSLAAMAVSGLFWRSLFVFNFGITRAIYLTIAFAVVLSLVNLWLGVNRISWTHAMASDIFRLIPGTLAATLGIAGLNRYVLPNTLWLDNLSIMPTRVILGAGVLAYGGFAFLRYRTRLLSGFATRWLDLRQQGLQKASERVLIVGSGESGLFTAWMMERQRTSLPMQVVGFIDDNPSRQGMLLHGIPVLGGRADISNLVKKHDIGLILFAIHKISDAERSEFLAQCCDHGVRVVLVPDLASTFNHALLDPDQLRPETGPERWITVPARALEIPLGEIEAALADDDPQLARLAVAHLRGLVQQQTNTRKPVTTPLIRPRRVKPKA